jgi:Domain of unknown function (DUF3846)
MKTGTMIRISPRAEVTQHPVEFAKTWPLEKMQELVGGYIERVRVRWDGRVRDAYIDEEGKLKGLAFNHFATGLLEPPLRGHDILVGPVVIWVPDAKPKPVNEPMRSGPSGAANPWG